MIVDLGVQIGVRLGAGLGLQLDLSLGQRAAALSDRGDLTSSSPESKFMPKKPLTAEQVPMHSPAILMSISSLAIRFRSLSRVSSRISCVDSMLDATCPRQGERV